MKSHPDTQIVVSFLRWRPPHFKFPEILPIMTTYDLSMAHSCQRTKFGANRSRISRYTPFCVFPETAVTAILNFQKMIFWTYSNTCIAHIYRYIKFGALDKKLAKICPFVYFQDGACRHLEFPKKCYSGSPVTLIMSVSVSISNLVQIGERRND